VRGEPRMLKTGEAELCHYVAFTGRRWSAASAAREKRTRRWVGAAPTGTGTRGKVAGEVSGSGVVGRLGKRALN
jgi:hypothetical protein